jgi:hypothetical protein
MGDIGDRRQAVASSSSTVRIYVVATVVLCAMAVAAVVLLAVLRPGDTASIATVVGIVTPITVALLAGSQNAMNASIDGRMTQLLHATAEKEKIKGLVEGLTHNPNSPITEDDVPPPLTK